MQYQTYIEEAAEPALLKAKLETKLLGLGAA